MEVNVLRSYRQRYVELEVNPANPRISLEHVVGQLAFEALLKELKAEILAFRVEQKRGFYGCRFNQYVFKLAGDSEVKVGAVSNTKFYIHVSVEKEKEKELDKITDVLEAYICGKIEQVVKYYEEYFSRVGDC